MPEPKNLAAIRTWMNKNRPDLASQLDALARNDAAILLLTSGFEAGRMFQSENPKSVPGNPIDYIA